MCDYILKSLKVLSRDYFLVAPTRRHRYVDSNDIYNVCVFINSTDRQCQCRVGRTWQWHTIRSDATHVSVFSVNRQLSLQPLPVTHCYFCAFNSVNDSLATQVMVTIAMGDGYHSNGSADRCRFVPCLVDVHTESMSSQIYVLETVAVGDVTMDTVSTNIIQLLCLNGCWETLTLLLLWILNGQ